MTQPQIVYNITIKLGMDTYPEWIAWMKMDHIPKVMATGKFLDWKIQKILGDDDPQAVTISVQYTAASMDDFMDYSQHHSQKLQREHKIRFEGRYVAFRTLMEVVDQS